MLFSTMGQGALWVWMMSCGAAMYVLALFLGALRRLMQAGFWLNLMLDLLLGMLCTGLFIAFLVVGNYGRMRMFEIFAAALGALAAHLALKPPLKWAANALLRLKNRIWTWLQKNRRIKVIFR